MFIVSLWIINSSNTPKPSTDENNNIVLVTIIVIFFQSGPKLWVFAVTLEKNMFLLSSMYRQQKKKQISNEPRDICQKLESLLMQKSYLYHDLKCEELKNTQKNEEEEIITQIMMRYE